MDISKFKLIRGARILQQIEEENALSERSSYQDLERRTITAFPRTRKRQHATHPVQIVRTDFTPYIGTRNLLVRGQAKSGTYNNVFYKPMLFFNEIKFEDEDTPQNVSFKVSGNEDYHMQPIDLSDNIVRVRCDCLDFYFRFSPWDFSNDDLFGPKPKPYVRKTNNYPPVNPTRSPGICKHIMKLVLTLRDARMLKR
ncbi:hypothetical protein LCGC14_1462130 [marine sediment metagenome]|uniref:Uncharacterized protein n=1 Tax=marine sediment metagenome TaxID=412755 RepID=A0A0F9JET7_9ZZZZ